MPETAGITSLLLYSAITILLIFLARDRRATGRRLHTLGLILTLVFIADLVLFMLLLAVPYFGYHARTYLSANDCFDPECWPPFGPNGFGLFLYQTSMGMWVFAAIMVAPLILLQVYILRSMWQNIDRAERIAHFSIISITSLVCVYSATIGHSIMVWLTD